MVTLAMSHVLSYVRRVGVFSCRSVTVRVYLPSFMPATVWVTLPRFYQLPLIIISGKFWRSPVCLSIYLFEGNFALHSRCFIWSVFNFLILCVHLFKLCSLKRFINIKWSPCCCLAACTWWVCGLRCTHRCLSRMEYTHLCDCWRYVVIISE